eukprot:TRINITY_DN6660_c0_g1_i2.p1 TRINITY_DN6660_c0_g1~~TRINITY_DN6660_c0_g1_i2.p1  ORF type:complete len:912 (+),score=106.66 TRINITY_DN6660_c0_g1_i2:236-2971(+)
MSNVHQLRFQELVDKYWDLLEFTTRGREWYVEMAKIGTELDALPSTFREQSESYIAAIQELHPDFERQDIAISEDWLAHFRPQERVEPPIREARISSNIGPYHSVARAASMAQLSQLDAVQDENQLVDQYFELLEVSDNKRDAAWCQSMQKLAETAVSLERKAHRAGKPFNLPVAPHDIQQLVDKHSRPSGLQARSQPSSAHDRTDFDQVPPYSTPFQNESGRSFPAPHQQSAAQSALFQPPFQPHPIDSLPSHSAKRQEHSTQDPQHTTFPRQGIGPKGSVPPHSAGPFAEDVPPQSEYWKSVNEFRAEPVAHSSYRHRHLEYDQSAERDESRSNTSSGPTLTASVLEASQDSTASSLDRRTRLESWNSQQAEGHVDTLQHGRDRHFSISSAHSSAAKSRSSSAVDNLSDTEQLDRDFDEWMQRNPNEEDDDWRDKMEILQVRLNSVGDPRASQVIARLQGSSSPELSPTSSLAPSMVAPSEAAPSDVASTEALLSKLMLSEPSIPAKSTSALDQLSTLFPQHDRRFLSQKLHLAFGNVEEAASLIYEEFEAAPEAAPAASYNHLEPASSAHSGPVTSHADSSSHPPAQRRQPARQYGSPSTRRSYRPLPSDTASFHTGPAVPASVWSQDSSLTTAASSGFAQLEDEAHARQHFTQINKAQMNFKLRMLQSFLPGHSDAVLCKALEDNGLDVERAAASLYEQEDSEVPSMVQATGPTYRAAPRSGPAASSGYGDHGSTSTRETLVDRLMGSDKSHQAIQDEIGYWQERRNVYRTKVAQARQRKDPSVSHYAAEVKKCTTKIKALCGESATRTAADHNDPDEIHRRLDLHGLRVREALEKVSELLAYHKQRRASLRGPDSIRYVDVITGVGRHSANGKARIKPELERWLNSKGIQYSHHQNGVIRIKLNSL